MSKVKEILNFLKSSRKMKAIVDEKKTSRKLKKNKKLETAFKKSEIFIESLKATTVVKCNKSILFQNHPQRYEKLDSY